MSDPLGAALAPLRAALDLAAAAYRWISARENWLRVALVVLGGAVAVGSAGIVVRPAVESRVKEAAGIAARARGRGKPTTPAPA